MSWNDLKLRFRALLFRKRAESDLQDELRFHLEMQTRKNLGQGLDTETAQHRAMSKFGGVQKFADACRDERGIRLIESTMQDVRYALRQFRRSRLFTLVAVLSLGLGIGANTALFTVIDTLYLRKLPVNQPDDLISFRWRAFGEANKFVPSLVSGSVMSTSDSDTGVEYTSSTSFLRATLDDFRSIAGLPAEVFAFAPFTASADIRAWPYEVSAQLVTGNYFSTLGVAAVAGRPLGPADDNPSAEPAAVISHSLWERAFNLDSTAIGEKVTVNGLPVTIVGVTPPGFHLAEGARPEFSLPLSFAPRVSRGSLAKSEVWWVRMMARKQTDATIEQVESALQGTFQARMFADTATLSPAPPREQVPRLDALDASRGFVEIAGSRHRNENLLITVSAVFVLLLFIVCLNVANLLVARAVAREYEIAMRLAIGASRGRLIRQLLTESVLLAVAGGLAGVIIAVWGKELLRAYFGEQIPLVINLRVLAFSAAVAVGAGILFGLVPAIQATRSNLNNATKRNARNAARPRARLNRTLVVIQIAMSVVLLIGAGLLVRTLGNWQRIDMGYNVDGLVIFEAPRDENSAGLYDRMTEGLRAVAGVTGVTTAGCFPPSECSSGIRNIDAALEVRQVQARRLVVDPGFFETMGISFLAGRNFDRRDLPAGTRVAVIDDALARRLYPDSNPIGKRFAFERRTDARDLEIVGIVKNAVIDVGRAEIRPTFYTAQTQAPPGSGSGFIVRTAEDTKTAIPAIRRAVAGVDASLPLFGLRTYKQLIEGILDRQRQLSMTWMLFGATGLLLTAIGLYGLMSYTVSRRVSEIGIRIALGATRFQVLVLVMQQIVALVLVGLIAGFTLSLGFNQVLWSFVFGVRVFDPWNFAIVAAVVCIVACLASFLPARRAARIDPVDALRCE